MDEPVVPRAATTLPWIAPRAMGRVAHEAAMDLLGLTARERARCT